MNGICGAQSPSVAQPPKAEKRSFCNVSSGVESRRGVEKERTTMGHAEPSFPPSKGLPCSHDHWSSLAKSIGFMPSSKIPLAVGGLLQTGGGTPGTLDVAKSLVLRGCVQQKMGKRNQAEGDYRRALELCRESADNDDRRKTAFVVTLNGESADEANRGRHVEKQEAENDMRKPIVDRAGLRANNADEADRNRTTDEMREGGWNSPRQPERSLNAPNGKDENDEISPCRWQKDESCLASSEILRLESLIHHNLATLHLAAVMCADPRAIFHKV